MKSPEISPARDVIQKIQDRVDKSLKTPGITPGQASEIEGLAYITEFALVVGSRYAVDLFGRQFIDLTDQIIAKRD